MTNSESDVLVSPIQGSKKVVSSEKPKFEETIDAVEDNNHVATNGDSKAGM